MFLLCDAMQDAVMPPYVVCLSICLSVTFSWNTLKLISQRNSLKYLLTFTPTLAIWSNGKTPKFRVEMGWGHEHSAI